MTPIELIAIDLDGTLLNSQHQLSDRNAETVRKAIERGVKVVLVTGKTHHSAKFLIEKLGLTTPGIYNQGLITALPDGKVTHQAILDPEVARYVITYAEDRGFDLAAYSGNKILVKRVTRWFEDLNKKYHEPMPEGIGPLQNILSDIPINKLMVLKEGDPQKVKALRWQFEIQLANKARMLQPSFNDMMEILPPNTGKGTALKQLLKDLGIKPEKVMAIGDGENDIDMFQLVGLGVAMGNSWDIVKSAANVVVGTNDEDGVAQAIEKFVLNETLPIATETATPTPVSVETPQPPQTQKEGEV
jgi:Cof subfamily protein (haloacid dehalogenase superfamily)